MSDIGQRQIQDQLHNISLKSISETSAARNSEDSAGDRLPSIRPRAPGALRLLQAYEREQGQRAKGKGGTISPQKVLLKWIQKLVRFILPNFRVKIFLTLPPFLIVIHRQPTNALTPTTNAFTSTLFVSFMVPMISP